MNKKFTEIDKKSKTPFSEKKISRKEAIKKTGYVAASAATMMVLLGNSIDANATHGHGHPRTSPVCTPNPGGNGQTNPTIPTNPPKYTKWQLKKFKWQWRRWRRQSRKNRLSFSQWLKKYKG